MKAGLYLRRTLFHEQGARVWDVLVDLVVSKCLFVGLQRVSPGGECGEEVSPERVKGICYEVIELNWVSTKYVGSALAVQSVGRFSID